MKKLILILVMIGTPVLAQKTTRALPDQDNDVLTWTNIAAGDSLIHDFYFSRRPERSSYSGYAAYYGWADTASGGAGARDSLLVYAEALKYDGLSSQYEVCQPGLCISGKDSINVLNWATWGTNHTDDNFTISKVLNVQHADGVRVVIKNAGAALMWRDELLFAQD